MALLIPAAQYLRMSTENQCYSLENQSTAIAEFADTHGFTIVKTYSDAARSGLTLKGRSELRQLISDAVSGQRHYSAVLVYDVSRWGRFQDVDESAHYEFLCKSAGVSVHYCAEKFENDGKLGSSLMKALKRSMAGEFSRELGVKVHLGKRAVAAAGFSVGGPTPFGFRRQIVSEDPLRCRILESGERKYVRSERLTLVPGPSDEVKCIREIFKRVLRDGLNPREIARLLNSKGVTIRGERWTQSRVYYILTNPEYAGVSTWGRTSQRLGLPRVKTAREQWVLKPDSFTPIVNAADFDKVQATVQREVGRVWWTPDRVLKCAQRLLRQHGKLTLNLFEKTPGCPSPRTLREMDYKAIWRSAGYQSPRQYLASSSTFKRTIQLHRKLVEDFATRFPDELSILPGRWPHLLFDHKFTVCLILCRARHIGTSEPRWQFSPVLHHRKNITILGLMDPSNTAPSDFVIFPSIPFQRTRQFGPDDSWMRMGHKLSELSQLSSELHVVANTREHLGT